MAETLPRRELGLTQTEAEALLRSLAGPAAPPIDVDRATASATPPAPPAIPTRPALATTPLPTLTEDAYKSLIESVPDALVVVDQLGRILLINAQTEALFGYTREELIGQPIEVLVPDRAREKHVHQRDDYFANPKARPMGQGRELVGRRADGHEVPVEISLSPLHTHSGLLVVATIRDVSDRRRSVAHLRKVEARYRTLVEGIPAVTFMAPMDEGPGELYVSPQIEALLGFSQREWVENPILWYTQLHPDDQARWHDEFARTVSTGEPFRSVYRFIARDGRVVWVHGEAKVIRDETGRPLFLQGIAFDITGIKQAEENLKALNATLDARVAERTDELARSNAALKVYAGTVAHDLKNPLFSIEGLVRKLNRGFGDPLGETGRGVLAELDDVRKRMFRLIKDLLDYSAVRTADKSLEPVDCVWALQEACADLRELIEQTGAEVTADELPTVLVDRTQLVQLFQNLIGNSLKYRAAEPPRVHITARREGDGWWAIEVKDNGIGIEAKHLEKIFILGTRSRWHHQDEIPGSGIGLTTCQTIVESHGGRIKPQSDGPGTGTTIAFTLPSA